MNSLWDFAVGIYQYSPIKTACLQLQDEAGADVCVLLAVVWLGKNGRHLTLAEIALLNSTVEVWQQKMTLPLRQLRRDIRQFIESEPSLDAEPIYQQIKAAELKAERVTMQQLQVLIEYQPLPITMSGFKSNKQASAMARDKRFIRPLLILMLARSLI